MATKRKVTVTPKVSTGEVKPSHSVPPETKPAPKKRVRVKKVTPPSPPPVEEKVPHFYHFTDELKLLNAKRAKIQKGETSKLPKWLKKLLGYTEDNRLSVMGEMYIVAHRTWEDLNSTLLVWNFENETIEV